MIIPKVKQIKINGLLWDIENLKAEDGSTLLLTCKEAIATAKKLGKRLITSKEIQDLIELGTEWKYKDDGIVIGGLFFPAFKSYGECWLSPVKDNSNIYDTYLYFDEEDVNIAIEAKTSNKMAVRCIQNIDTKDLDKYPLSWDEAFGEKPIKGTRLDDNKRINTFKTDAQAIAVQAYAQLTQLLALPCYNGDWVPNWNDENIKNIIYRIGNKLVQGNTTHVYHKIALKNQKKSDIFFNLYQDLLKQLYEIE